MTSSPFNVWNCFLRKGLETGAAPRLANTHPQAGQQWPAASLADPLVMIAERAAELEKTNPQAGTHCSSLRDENLGCLALQPQTGYSRALLATEPSDSRERDRVVGTHPKNQKR